MNDIMTIAEAAEYVGLAYSSLAEAVRKGRVEGQKSGGTWLVTVEALEEALAAGRIRPRKREENEDVANRILE